jgi:two-component system sensor histidine kinase MtrB
VARQVAQGRVAWVRTGSGRSSRVVVGGTVPEGPALYLFFPLADLAADLDVLRNVLAGVSGALVLVSAAIGALAARRVLRPLRRARGAVHRLEVGLYETRLPEEGGDEFADLAHSFNRMADALEASVRDLRALEASHRRFVSDVAHELRTPLTALTTSADVLEAHAGGLDDQGRRAARLLVLESRRLAALVEDLMEISRLDAGVAAMRWEAVDLAAVVAGALAVRGWGSRARVVADGPAETWADRRRVDTIVANLVGNALEHGSPPVTVTIGAGETAVTLAVSDAGPGIAPEHLDHLFDRFYKADPSRPRSEGSGLGLAIARENARLHGGDVAVVSRPGGTTFTLTLPRRSGPPEVADAPVARPLPGGDEAVTTGRLTVLTGRRSRSPRR